MRRGIAAVVCAIILIALAGCKIKKGENDHNSGGVDTKIKCSEIVRNNCMSGSQYLGEGGVRKTLWDGQIILPVGIEGEVNAPYPDKNKYKAKNRNRVIRFIATWLRYDGKPQGMNIVWGVGTELREDRSKKGTFDRTRSMATPNELATISVTPVDNNFTGWALCAVYLWGPKPSGDWGWIVVRGQPEHPLDPDLQKQLKDFDTELEDSLKDIEVTGPDDDDRCQASLWVP